MYAEINEYTEKINKLVNSYCNKGFSQDYIQAVIKKSCLGFEFFENEYHDFDAEKYVDWHDFEMTEENQLTENEIAALPAMNY